MQRSRRHRAVPKGWGTTHIRVSDDFAIWIRREAERWNMSIAEYTRQWYQAISQYRVQIPGSLVNTSPVPYRHHVDGSYAK